MSNESMANSITDVPSAIAELLAVNKQLEQQLSKAQADLEMSVRRIERVLLNMEQESPSYQYCYDLLFETYEELKIKRINK